MVRLSLQEKMLKLFFMSESSTRASTITRSLSLSFFFLVMYDDLNVWLVSEIEISQYMQLYQMGFSYSVV